MTPQWPMPEPPGRRGARALRVGDDERRRMLELLQVHCGAGRLDLAEFQERADQALAARTYGELWAVAADLPDLPDHPLPAPAAISRSAPASGSDSRGRWTSAWLWLPAVLVLFAAVRLGPVAARLALVYVLPVFMIVLVLVVVGRYRR